MLVFLSCFFLFFLHVVTLFFGLLYLDNGGLVFDWSVFCLGGVMVDFTFLVDWVSLIFSSFVLFISCMVVLYSSFYMSGDASMRRFLFLLLFFVLSMIFLIYSCGLFSLMIGWDGLGVVSFCLVIYYSDKIALFSGLITLYSNRLGDIFIILSIYYSFLLGFWGLDFDLMGDSFFLGVFIFLASLTKSAQFPFSAWLPAAMSAPTPISSLVHSSTLVTAGCYLVLRFSFILVSFFVSSLLSFLSVITMVLAGLAAVYEVDMSSVVAMSTLSQLGLMFFLLSVGEWMFSFYHLLVHALFKSLMFLSCGGFIFNFFGDQDYRFKGSSSFALPFFSFFFFLSSLALIGFPFVAGFYSKDMALDLLFAGDWFFLLYLFFFFGCVLTVLYSFRILILGIGSSFLSGSFFSFGASFFSFLGVWSLGFWSVFIGLLVGYGMLDGSFLFFSFPFKAIGVYVIVMSFICFYYVFLVGGFSFFLGGFSGLFFLSSKPLSYVSFVFWRYIMGDYTWVEKFGSASLYNSIFAVGGSVYYFDLVYYLAWAVVFSFWGVVSFYFFYWVLLSGIVGSASLWGELELWEGL